MAVERSRDAMARNPELIPVVSALRTRLLDGGAPLPKRFRALFSLMNVKCPESVDALIAGEAHAGGGGAATPKGTIGLPFPTLGTLPPNPGPRRSLVPSPPLSSRPAFDDPSALFRHEIAFCLGQMQDATAIPKLKARGGHYPGEGGGGSAAAFTFTCRGPWS